MHILEIRSDSYLLTVDCDMFEFDKFLEDAAIDELLKAELEKYDDEKTRKSSRNDHPDWFKPLAGGLLGTDPHGGINPKFNSKEDYFNHNFENRIRKFYKIKRSPSEIKRDRQKGIFEKLKNDINKKYHKKVQEVWDDFCKIKNSKKETESRKHFDRKSTVRMCSELGEYRCKNYLQEECPHSHSINPYRSRGETVLFSTWTLDHM